MTDAEAKLFGIMIDVVKKTQRYFTDIEAVLDAALPWPEGVVPEPGLSRPPDDHAYVRVPAVGERVRSIDGRDGTVRYIVLSNTNYRGGIQIEVLFDGEKSIGCKPCDTIEPIGPNPRFVLVPKGGAS